MKAFGEQTESTQDLSEKRRFSGNPPDTVTTSVTNPAATSRRLTRSAILGLAACFALVPATSLGASPPPHRIVNQPNAEDWSMFHHDPTHLGVSPDAAVGATAATAGLTLTWQVPTGSMIESSPAVVYNSTLSKTLVYVQTWNNVLLALDASTGTTVWSYTEPGPLGADSSPAVYGNTVYVGTVGAHTLFAVDATYGTFQCSFNTGGRVVSAPVVADLGSGPEVFFGDTGLHEKNNAGHEWAITGVGNPAGGCQFIWSYNKWAFTSFGKDGGSWSPPALAYDVNQRPLLVFGSNQPDNSVYVLNAFTGKRLWRYRTATTGDLDVGAGPTITAPGVNGFADGEVYIPGKNGILYAFDLTTGTISWSFNLLTKLAAGRTYTFVSTPAVVGNVVYIGYGPGVWAFDATTGAELWYSGTAHPVGKVLSSPAVAGAAADQVIYSNDVGGAITAYRPSDGAALWHYSTSLPLYGSDAVSDGHVYFGGIDGNVYAFGP
jgi:outer membrane protein assembly factor BamB